MFVQECMKPDTRPFRRFPFGPTNPLRMAAVAAQDALSACHPMRGRVEGPGENKTREDRSILCRIPDGSAQEQARTPRGLARVARDGGRSSFDSSGSAKATKSNDGFRL